MHQRCCHWCMKKGHFVVHISPRRISRGLLGLVRLVGTCWEFVGTCRDLSGLVGACQDLSGVVGNVDFMESHFEGITIVVNKILAKFPIPKILRSVPALCYNAYCRYSTYKRVS